MKDAKNKEKIYKNIKSQRFYFSEKNDRFFKELLCLRLQCLALETSRILLYEIFMALGKANIPGVSNQEPIWPENEFHSILCTPNFQRHPTCFTVNKSQR